MTPPDAEREIAHVKTLLGLKDWTIRLRDEPPDEDDCAAQVRPIYGRKVAELRLSSGWFDDHWEERAKTLTHELLHLHLHPVQTAAEMAAQRGLTIDAYTLWSQQFDLLVEYAVDGIAEAVGSLLPPEGDE